MKRRLWPLPAALAMGAALSAASATEITDSHLERLDYAVRTMLINLAADPLFADFSPDDWQVLLTRMPEDVESFGLILNPRHDSMVDSEGLLVLGVTPGSPAARMGVRSGDRLQVVNGRDLRELGSASQSHSAAYELFQQTVADLDDGAVVEIEVERGDRMLVLEGEFRRLYLPAATLELSGRAGSSGGTPADTGSGADSEPCAMVTVRGVPPRDFDIFGAEITEINAKRAGAGLRATHHLVPGTYTFTVEERIPGHELKLELQRFDARRPPLQITLDLIDEQVYYLGSKLLMDRREQSRDQPYWKPVLWKTEPGRCRGKPVER